jgi:hypothetical protein
LQAVEHQFHARGNSHLIENLKKIIPHDEVARGLGGLYLRDVRAAYRSGGVSGLAQKAARLRLRHVKRLVRKVVG